MAIAGMLISFITIAFWIIILLIVGAFNGKIFNDRHCTKREAQKIAEELTGQEVTYVTTNEIPEEKK